LQPPDTFPEMRFRSRAGRKRIFVVFRVDRTHGRSQRVQWVHLHPQGGEKNLSVIYTENL